MCNFNYQLILVIMQKILKSKTIYKKIPKIILYKSLFFMKRLRALEEKILKEYHPEDKMRCPIHLCIGQETVSSVLNLFLRKNDFLFSHHRSHGYYLSKSCNLNALVAELYGKETGSNMGLAGSQDISSARNNFFAGAILSGAIGISVGAAYGLKYNNLNNFKSVCCFGEGAVDQGIFWEAINYASLKNLPSIFICENNKYATYSNISKRMKNINISEKVKKFGIKIIKVFGNDFAEVYHAIKKAFALKEPVFIETKTYRISSHVGTEDDSKFYRNKKEINLWKKKCPIKNLEKYIQLKSKDLKNIDSEIEKAFSLARKSKFFKIKNWENLNINISNKNNTAFNDYSYSNQDTLPEPY